MTQIERKVDEVFEYNGVKLKVAIEGSCRKCYFTDKKCGEPEIDDIIGQCLASERKDNNAVIFIEANN